LPWLVLALLGGFISVKVLGLFEGYATTRKFILFTPLIAWQEMLSAIFGNYCARFGKQYVERIFV
jgi:hypothetical protein